MRLFTAICFDEGIKNALFSAQTEAKKFFEGKFPEKENFHLTLVFIGETEKEDEIQTALSGIEFPAFEIKLKGCGFFEKGIFWAGTEENKNLFELQKAVSKALNEIEIETEEREFVPHITLAKKFFPGEDFSPEKIAEYLPKETVKVNQISLMKSENISGRLFYTEIYSKNLI